MTSMWIDVYNYTTGTAFSVHIGGYIYVSGNTWQHHPSVMIIGANHRVRLGYDNGFKIYIGETNSNWSYPQVVVRDVLLGYNGSGSYNHFIKDWSITFTTTLPTIPDNANRVEYAWTTRNFNPSNYALASSYVKKSGDEMTGSLVFARGIDDGFIFNKYNNTNYPVLRSHNNGNISLSASGSGLYIGF
jgi:hypothetical protein